MCRGAMLASQCWSGCHAVNQAAFASRARHAAAALLPPIASIYIGAGAAYAQLLLMSLERLRSAPPCGVEPSFGQLCWSYLSLVVMTHDETRAQSAAASISEVGARGERDF